MKILALGPNSTKFYTHNLWATRRLEMQKLDADRECNDELMGVVVQETRGGCGGGMPVSWMKSAYYNRVDICLCTNTKILSLVQQLKKKKNVTTDPTGI